MAGSKTSIPVDHMLHNGGEVPGVGDDRESDDTRLVGKVLYWIYDGGAEPRIGDGQFLNLQRMFALSPLHSRAAVCQDKDGAIFVFDMRWATVRDRIVDLDKQPVNWYTSIDEAIVRTMMEFNGT